MVDSRAGTERCYCVHITVALTVVDTGPVVSAHRGRVERARCENDGRRWCVCCQTVTWTSVDAVYISVVYRLNGGWGGRRSVAPSSGDQYTPPAEAAARHLSTSLISLSFHLSISLSLSLSAVTFCTSRPRWLFLILFFI